MVLLCCCVVTIKRQATHASQMPLIAVDVIEGRRVGIEIPCPQRAFFT